MCGKRVNQDLPQYSGWLHFGQILGLGCGMMSRTKIVLIVILSVGSACAMVASILYSYASNTVWYLGPRIAITPTVVLIPIIFAVDVLASIRLMRKKETKLTREREPR
jgi:hypothetical protein